MATKPLKSLKFPTLDDTYTVPQVDDTLAVQGAAADAKKVGDELTDIKGDLSDILETCDLPVKNWYIDMSETKLMADASSATFLLDITREDVTEYIVQIVGNSNRCRILALTNDIDHVTVGNTGSFSDLGNTTKKFVIKKSDYANYKTIAITTNYQNTPFAQVSVTLQHTSPSLWERVINDNTRIDSISNAISQHFSGNLIYAENTIYGDISVTNKSELTANVISIGKNLIDTTYAENGGISPDTGEDTQTANNIRGSNYIPVINGGKYVMSCAPVGLKHGLAYMRLSYYNANKEHISREEHTGTEERGLTSAVFNVPNNAKYVRWSINTYGATSDGNPFLIKDIGILNLMLENGNVATEYAKFQSSEIVVDNGSILGELKSYNDATWVWSKNFADTVQVNIPMNIVKILDSLTDDGDDYTENECRNRFRLAMTEKATRIGMSGTTVGDGGGWPIPTNITALDAIKMLCHAMSYPAIAETWSYDTKIIRTKEVENTITMNSTLFTDPYITDLTNYYTVLGFKTGAGHLHNLVCACTSDDLNGNVLVGCISLTQVSDDANINRPKAMKVLMDMGKALLANRSADVSSYTSTLNSMTAQRYTIVVLPYCSTKLLQRYDFDGSYSLLYNKSSDPFYSFSMIKLLCAMTALDYIDNLDEAHAVVTSDLLIGTGAYGPLFQAGEVITFRDALSALLIPSCNQAAYFLERLVGKKMLEKYGEDGFLPTD